MDMTSMTEGKLTRNLLNAKFRGKKGNFERS